MCDLFSEAGEELGSNHPAADCQKTQVIGLQNNHNLGHRCWQNMAMSQNECTAKNEKLAIFWVYCYPYVEFVKHFHICSAVFSDFFDSHSTLQPRQHRATRILYRQNEYGRRCAASNVERYRRRGTVIFPMNMAGNWLMVHPIIINKPSPFLLEAGCK